MSKAIGIDLGGTNIKGALVDDQGQIILRRAIPTAAEEGPRAVIERIRQLITELAAGQNPSEVEGIGVGIPGQPEAETGLVLYAPNLKWQNVPLGQELRRYFDYPVYMDNDANAAALGEFLYGAGQGSHNMVAVTIGTGIGAGIIIEGKLYRGSAWSAGELGHTVVLPGGPPCSCGNQGCLETLTAGPALLRLAGDKIKQGQSTALAGYNSLEARDIFWEAQTGDKAASEIISEMAYYLGIGIANIINILNPDRVVVGGGVAQAGDILFKPLKEWINKQALPIPAKTTQIVPALLGNDAGSIGAASLVFKKS